LKGKEFGGRRHEAAAVCFWEALLRYLGVMNGTRAQTHVALVWRREVAAAMFCMWVGIYFFV